MFFSRDIKTLTFFLDLLKHQVHAQIGEECRRQLMRTAPRDEEMAEPPAHVLEEMLTAGF